jgi:hypothetical protein
MNPQIITTIGAAVGMLLALWTIMSNFDKRNGDRFTATEKGIHVTKEILRAEMQTTRAELRLEIRQALVGK